MRYTINDTRALTAAIVLPASDKFFNWTTGGFETPFAAAVHLKPFVALEAAPSIFATVLSVDLGDVLTNRLDAALVIVQVDGAGVPLEAIDVGTLPYPIPTPTCGGFSR